MPRHRRLNLRDILSDIVPHTDNFYDIGTEPKRIKDIRVAGVAYLPSIDPAPAPATHAPTHGEGGDDEIADALSLEALAKVLERTQKFNGIFWFCNNWTPANFIASSKTGSGTFNWYNEYIRLHTGATINSYAGIRKAVLTPVPYTWNKKRYFMARIVVDSYTSQRINVESGIHINNYDINYEKHIGFKVLNNTLYATVGNGGAESTITIETFSSTIVRTLEAILTPAVEVRFYVDGVDKGALSTNLPSGTGDSDVMFCAGISNTIASDRFFDVCEVKVLQEE